MSIIINNLYKNYGKKPALVNISLSINKGITGLLGPNGAGKSSLIKIMCCYLMCNRGEVYINGIDIKKKPMIVKKNIGYLPENNPLYQDVQTYEYLNFIRKIRKVKKYRLNYIIEKTGLNDVLKKKIIHLSKGFKQRIGIAQTLIHDPSVIILDEPTNGLDPNQVIEIRGLIKDISQNKTVIISTHILQEVDALCENIVIINNGKIISNESKEIIKQKSKSIEDYFHNITN